MIVNSVSMVFDYLVFLVLMVASLGVAFYSRCKGKKESSKADYVFAVGSKVSMGAMLLSFARGTLGVRSFLGYPSELYYYGSAMYEILYGMLLAYPIVAYFFVPVYYNLGITSVYQVYAYIYHIYFGSVQQFTVYAHLQVACLTYIPRQANDARARSPGTGSGTYLTTLYLDLRFKSKVVRSLASGTYIFRNMLNLGVTVFTPCVALKTVVGFPYWFSIAGIVTISIICSVAGGLKAAITADVIQGLIMIGCSLAIIIQGAIDTGGIDYIVKTNVDQGRLHFFNFDLDPTIRVTTISAIVGQLFMSLSIFGCQQNFVQRYCSMESERKVRKTLWSNVPVIAVLFTLSWIAGMVMFADYLHCDPLSLGFISKIDEIVPFYIEDKFTHIPGLLGVFMASLFNGALSLAISNLNSMATVAWEDFFSKLPCLSGLNDKQQLHAIRLLCVVLGIITMGIAFGVGFMSGVIESSQLMTSATSGPLLGVFLLAMFFPACNWKGAIGGMVFSHCFTIWLVFGGATVDKPKLFLPLSTDGCSNNSFSAHSFPTDDLRPTELRSFVHWINASDARSSYLDDTGASTSLAQDKDILTQIYSVSYMYYSFLGCAVCIVMGLLISYITGTSEEDIYEEKLIHPWALKVSKWLPGSKRQFLKDTSRGQSPVTGDIQVTKTSADLHTPFPRYTQDRADEKVTFHRAIIINPDSLNHDSEKRL